MDYNTQYDISMLLELRDLTHEQLAEALGVTPMTLHRWLKGGAISDANRRSFYEYAWEKKVPINKIKAQLSAEEQQGTGVHLLYHGAKTAVEGALNAEKSRPNNDFGKGFYCGESMEQSAMFVSAFPESSLYILRFEDTGLNRQEYYTDRDWMLTIALHRGRLGQYKGHPLLEQLRQRAEAADYIVAPIADNRMFEIIDSFIDGEITDIQCQHCLSATYLGRQFVFKSQRALEQATLLRRCYLTEGEKRAYLRSREESSRVSNDKVKIARREYRNQGKYIEELFE